MFKELSINRMSAISERNRLYHEQQAQERNRRREENLYVQSTHTVNHWEAQKEFRSWFKQTYGMAEFPSFPMWVSSTTKNGYQIHTWLMAKPEHVMMAKLRWS